LKLEQYEEISGFGKNSEISLTGQKYKFYTKKNGAEKFSAVGLSLISTSRLIAL
jgi:hypothetical protein